MVRKYHQIKSCDIIESNAKNNYFNFQHKYFNDGVKNL